MIVAIAGASGLTGSFCLEYLLQRAEVDQVIAIVRRPLQIVHPKLRQVLLQQGRLIDTVKCDAFISCLGTTIKKAGSKDAFEAVDRHLPVSLATILYQQGCQKAAVVSSMSADMESRFFYNRVKGLMEDDLQQMSWESLHILRPSIISGNRQESRPVERFFVGLAKLLHPLMRGKLKDYQAIEASDIAKALVNCTLSPDKGHFIHLSSTIKLLANK